MGVRGGGTSGTSGGTGVRSGGASGRCCSGCSSWWCYGVRSCGGGAWCCGGRTAYLGATYPTIMAITARR